MSYKSKEDIIKLISDKNYEYLWINTYSDIYLKEIKSLTIEDKKKLICSKLDELIEAKLFNINDELSIIQTDEEGKFSVAEFNSNDYECYIEEQQVLDNNKLYGNKSENIKFIIIRHYLKYDEDGQAYIAYTKLCEVKEEK